MSVVFVLCSQATLGKPGEPEAVRFMSTQVWDFRSRRAVLTHRLPGVESSGFDSHVALGPSDGQRLLGDLRREAFNVVASVEQVVPSLNVVVPTHSTHFIYLALLVGKQYSAPCFSLSVLCSTFSSHGLGLFILFTGNPSLGSSG